jgi:hypothetical protein
MGHLLSACGLDGGEQLPGEVERGAGAPMEGGDEDDEAVPVLAGESPVGGGKDAAEVGDDLVEREAGYLVCGGF